MKRRAAFVLILPAVVLALLLSLRSGPAPELPVGQIAPPPAGGLYPADLATPAQASPAAPPAPGALPAAPAQVSQAYARLLARHVRVGTIDGVRLHVVDYAAIRQDPDLRLALDDLASARPEAMGRDEQLAFWINAYNLLAIRLVADAYPVGSIRDLESDGKEVWGMVAGTAGGRLMSLGEIEHVMLRRQFREPRIHFALVAAAISCPDLRREPYDGARLDEQLEEAARAFLADENRGVRRDRQGHGVEASQLFHWFHEDFEPAGVVAFIRAHAPANVAAWVQGLDDHDLERLPYEWSLNDRARASVAGAESGNPAK
jgi:hypothetical protein